MMSGMVSDSLEFANVWGCCMFSPATVAGHFDFGMRDVTFDFAEQDPPF
jgi:hypothetical protein